MTNDYTKFPDVPLVKIGTYGASTGVIQLNREDIDSIVAASHDIKIGPGAVSLGHDDIDLGDRRPTYGYVDNLEARVDDDGVYTAFGDVHIMSELAEIAPRAYPNRSVELVPNYKTNPMAKTVYPRVLKTLALLGATTPAIEGMKGLVRSFASRSTLSKATDTTIITITQESAMTENLSIAIADVVDQFYDQLNEANPNSYAGVREPMDDSLIVCGTDGELYQVSWTADTDGLVTFGDPERVAIAYVPDPDSAEDGPVPSSLAFLSRLPVGAPLRIVGAAGQSENMSEETTETEVVTAEVAAVTPDVTTTETTEVAETETSTEVATETVPEVDVDLAALTAAAASFDSVLITNDNLAAFSAANAELKTLREANAAAAANAAAEAHRAEGVAFLSRACKDEGRFPVAQMARFEKYWNTDAEGCKELVMSFAANTIPTVTLGTSQVIDPTSPEALRAAYHAIGTRK